MFAVPGKLRACGTLEWRAMLGWIPHVVPVVEKPGCPCPEISAAIGALVKRARTLVIDLKIAVLFFLAVG